MQDFKKFGATGDGNHIKTNKTSEACLFQIQICCPMQMRGFFSIHKTFGMTKLAVFTDLHFYKNEGMVVHTKDINFRATNPKVPVDDGKSFLRLQKLSSYFLSPVAGF